MEASNVEEIERTIYVDSSSTSNKFFERTM